MADERYIALGNMAEGVAGALQKKADAKHQEESDRNKMIAQMVSKGIESGSIKDPNAAFQFLISGGKPGKGKKSELPPMLKTMIGSTKHLFGGGKTSEADEVAGRMASAQKPQGQPQRPGAGGGGPAGVQFLSPEEKDAADLAQQKKVNTQITEPNADAASKRRIAEIEAQGKNKGGPGTLIGRVQTAIEDFKQKHGGADPSPEEENKIVDDARAAWQSAGKQGTDYKQFSETWLKDATDKAGHALSAGEQKREMLLARKAWSLQETSADKLSRAKALEKFKSELSGDKPEDIKALSQSVSIGDSTRSYFDLSTVSGSKEKNAAAKAAIAQGIIPVTAKQAEQLESAQAASQNVQGFLDQIQSKLPADAANRPLTSIENKLSTVFQTDDDLASAIAWDTTVFPTLRAMSVSGRISNKEIDLAMKSRPRLTDTVSVAAKKMAVINKILMNGANPILNRGGTVSTGDGGSASPASSSKPGAVPPGVSNFLKGKKKGHYTIRDSRGNTTDWDVSDSGVITASKKAS